MLDRALIRQMGTLGLLGADLPETHGGLALSGAMSAAVRELSYRALS